MKAGAFFQNKSGDSAYKLFMNFLVNSNINKLGTGAFSVVLEVRLAIPPPDDSNWKLRISQKNGLLYYKSKLGEPSLWHIPDDVKQYIETYIPNCYKSLIPSPNYGQNVESLCIKLNIISPITRNFELFGKYLISVNEDDFIDEINKHTNIYQKTVNYMLPICPSIVFSDIVAGDNAISLLENIEDCISYKDKPEIQNLIYYIRTYDVKIGIIAMEYKNSIEVRKITEPLATEFMMGRFILLKLALDTGYNQDDFHPGNILVEETQDYAYVNDTPIDETALNSATSVDDIKMICSDYVKNANPAYRWRPFIIDFGRAVKIKPNVLSLIRDCVKRKDYYQALKHLCDIRTTKYTFDFHNQRSYGWVCDDYNLTSKPADIEYNDTYRTMYRDYLAKSLYGVEYNSLDSKQKVKVYNNLTQQINKFHSEIRPFNDREKEYINSFIGSIFEKYEIAIDNNVKIMEALHRIDPKYPRLPLDTSIRNSLYSGFLVGGLRKSSIKRYRKGSRSNLKGSSAKSLKN